jgi:hypothetical protein
VAIDASGFRLRTNPPEGQKRSPIRKRFWIEAAGALISTVLTVITLISREWIEFMFGVDPDGGSGSLEWSIVLAAVSLTVLLSAMARYEWRRAVADNAQWGHCAKQA